MVVFTTKLGRAVSNGVALVLIGSCLGLVACNVDDPEGGTGGLGDDADDDDDDADDDTSETDGGDGAADDDTDVECPRGATVLLSDYVSTQIALTDQKGETLSASFISSASSDTAGLAFALSGDVVLPSAAPASERIVLLDRFGTNVITWLDPQTGDALGQLPVGTGFESNPVDYVEVGDGLAFVSRWGQNTDPGNEPFDRGGDVLVIDTEAPEIVDAIELAFQDDLPPRPGAMLRHEGQMVVILNRVATDFSSTGEAMWAAIDIESRDVEWMETLTGLKNCGRPTPSPDGSRWALACTGAFDTGEIEDIAQSALLILDPSQDPPMEVERYTAEELVDEPIQGGIAYASDEVILFKTQTPRGGATNNRLMALKLDSGDVTELLEAAPDEELGGKGLMYGSVLCAPQCSELCLMPDADQGVLQRIEQQADGDFDIEAITVERSVGLPPVDLAWR